MFLGEGDGYKGGEAEEKEKDEDNDDDDDDDNRGKWTQTTMVHFRHHFY